MTNRRHFEWACYVMTIALIVGTIIGVAARLPPEDDATRAIAALSTRLDIEREEREDLARTVRQLERRMDGRGSVGVVPKGLAGRSHP